MDNQCLISVVMPVYGVEKWLTAAAKSVLDQTERRLELILVDDASPDKSGALCDGICRRDDRARVIHLAENGGLSHARNTGLAEARGRYVFFMDSDDVIEPQLLENALRAAEKMSSADWVVFGLTEEHYDESGTLRLTKKIAPENQLCETEESMRRAILPLEKKTVLGYAWNKLYRTDFLRENDLKFESVELIEDILFNLACAKHAKNMVILAETGYRYARREKGSLTGRVLENYFELNSRRVEELLSLHDEWNLTNEDVISALAAIYARYILSALERLYDPRRRISFSEKRAWIRALRKRPLYRRLKGSFHGPIGLIAGLPGLALPAGWALHVMHTRLNGLFRLLRSK